MSEGERGSTWPWCPDGDGSSTKLSLILPNVLTIKLNALGSDSKIAKQAFSHNLFFFRDLLCRKRFLCWSLCSIPCNNYVDSLYCSIMTTKKHGGVGRPSSLGMRTPEKVLAVSWQKPRLWKGRYHPHTHSGYRATHAKVGKEAGTQTRRVPRNLKEKMMVVEVKLFLIKYLFDICFPSQIVSSPNRQGQPFSSHPKYWAQCATQSKSPVNI